MGNMPGHFKRLSISFYTRCLMFDRAHGYGIHPDRPHIFLPVTGANGKLRDLCKADGYADENILTIPDNVGGRGSGVSVINILTSNRP